MIKFAHVINPVKVGGGSDLHAAQPVTFATMRTAKQHAEKTAEVALYAAFFPEDEDFVPGFFNKTKLLSRSVLDSGTFESNKKLPFIKDILDRLWEASSADYFIYTNVDISLMPDFYIRLKEIIDRGFDGVIINRRTISGRHTTIEEIPLMIEEARNGKKHPGYDCFVFRREAYRKFVLGESCVGANWIGRILISNIAAFSRSFHIFEDLHLTFHIGDDRIWLNKKYRDLEMHNEEQLIRILKELLENGDTRNRKLLKDFYIYHMKKHFYQGRPADIIRRNSPRYRLPVPPQRLYPVASTSRFSDRAPASSPLRQDPVFVVGYPRSGTTFVQSLIGTQKGLVPLNETHFFSRAWKDMRFRKDKIVSGCIDAVIAAIRSGIAFSADAADHVRRMAEEGVITPKMLFEAVIIDNLFQKVGHRGLQHARWVEKTPHHVFHLEKIFAFYPQAKVVYVLRHPEKAIVSRRNSFLFGDEHMWPLQKHARQWLNGIHHMEKHKRLRPESVIVARLEDLNADRMKEMGRICAFLKIDFDAGRLNNYREIAKTLIYPWEFWKTDFVKDSRSKQMAKFQERLSAEDRHELLRIGGRKMQQYGYIESSPQVSSLGLLRSRMNNAGLFTRLARRKIARVLPAPVKRCLKKVYFLFVRS